MSFLARKFILFFGVLGVLFGSVFVSFRCGFRQGLEDAPRLNYSVDIARALRDNGDFRKYLAELYRSAYVHMLDSLIRTDDLVSVYGEWLDQHPGCQMKKEVPLKIGKNSADRVFFKGVKF